MQLIVTGSRTAEPFLSSKVLPTRRSKRLRSFRARGSMGCTSRTLPGERMACASSRNASFVQDCRLGNRRTCVTDQAPPRGILPWEVVRCDSRKGNYGAVPAHRPLHHPLVQSGYDSIRLSPQVTSERKP